MSSPTTSSSPSIVPTPIFHFITIAQPITCDPLNIEWFYSGPSSPINFIATNVGVSQDIPAPPLTSTPHSKAYTDNRRAIPPGAATPTPFVIAPFASNVDPQSMAYTWSSVNVPQGWYVINGTMPVQSYTQLSPPFFVHTGNDTSCLAAIASSSSSIPTPTAGLPGDIPAIGGSKINLALVVGVSLGTIAAVAIALTAAICLYRKGLRSGVMAGADSKASSNRWNGLSSVDSKALTSFPPTTVHSVPRHQIRSESMGTIAMTYSEEAVGAEKNSVYGKYSDDGPGLALATMPVLNHQSPRSKVASRTYSASSSTSNGFSPNEFALPRARRPSVADSITPRRSIDSSNVTYPPISPSSPHGGRSSTQFTAANMSRSHSNGTSSPSQSTAHGIANQYYAAPSPSPTSDATKQANRVSLGGRKRKPVPTYDPGEESATPSVPQALVSPSSASSVPDHVAMNGGHYSTRNQAGQENTHPNLAHKNSFGPGGVEGKPLHYLMPDMPMPLKD